MVAFSPERPCGKKLTKGGTVVDAGRLSLGPPLATISAYTGSFLVSVCTFNWKRSASSACSICRISGLGGLLKFAGTNLLESEDAGGFASTSNRSSSAQRGPPRILYISRLYASWINILRV